MIKYLLTVCLCLMAFLLAGCGGSTSDSGFPEQQPITPTTGVLEGRVQLPDLVNDANLNNSILRINPNSLVRLSIGQITNYSGFIVTAQYTSSAGSLVIVNGSVNADGTYFISGLPFGEELEVTVSQGKLALKATVPPLQQSNPQLIKNVDVTSTAETLLYNQIKNNQPLTTIETIDQFQSFESEKILLAELISNELKNENVDSNTKPLLERTLVTENLVRSAEFVEGTTLNDNHLPYSIIDQVQQNQRGKVELSYRLFDAELDLANVNLMYSIDGLNFTTATVGSGGSGVSNLETLRNDGFQHNLFWESAADLGVGIQQNVTLAIDAYPFNVSQTEEFKTRALTVSFSVDNRGLPEITALSSANHQLGSSSVINIQGNNLSVVTKVYLEHFGDESFINPNSLELSSSEFQIISDQQIDIFVPAYGLFPVDYRIVLQGDLVTDNSISTQTISVQEIFAPNFSNIQVGLSPSSIENDSGEQISFQGFNLMGSYADRVKIRLSTSPSVEYELSPISAVLINNTGLIRWSGSVPTRIQTGVYDILIRNSCNPLTPCGDEVLVTENGVNSVNLTVIESAAQIDDVKLDFGIAVNNTNSRVTVIGQRLSSVSEARISTDRDVLVNSFSSGFPLNITSTAYDFAELVFPLGGAPGTFYVAVMNQGGITVSNSTFIIQEGVVPANSIAVQVETTAGAVITNNTSDNVTDFQLRITGTSLSSLETVRLVNQDIASVVVNLSPFQTTFTEALVLVPRHNPPGRYSLDLINSAGLTSTNCGSFSCLEITEDLPIVTTFQNLIKPQDLEDGQMIAGENAVLEIMGSNLSGAVSGKLCDTLITCPYSFASVSGEFFKAIANITSSAYMKPGTYFLEVTNKSGSTQTTTNNRLEIFERQPVVDSVIPRTLTNRELIDQANTITFNGRNLYGVNEICLLPQDSQSSSCSLTCTSHSSYRFTGSEVVGLGRNQTTLNLTNNTQIIPGEYVWIVKNFAPIGTDNSSVCNPLLHSMSITEPTLEFISFAGSPTPSSTSVSGHATSQIKVIGQFMYGVDKVEIKRRFDVFNVSSVFDLQIDTTTLNSVDLTVPSSLIPGTYDLLMKNSGMSVPLQLTASVVVSEVLTPVISEIRLRGSNQENTSIIFFDIYGDQIAGAALTSKDIKLVDIKDPSNVIPIPANSINLSAEVDETLYITIGIPAGTSGGDYRVLLTNSAFLTTAESSSPVITIFEPPAQFQSVSVIGPFNQQFGFGENNRNTRLEFRGLNLGSSDEIRLTREPEFTGDSQDKVTLLTSEIFRKFGSTELTLTSTLETFLRPGFYDVEIRNNSGEFSTLIDPISSPFFEQVQVLEGAPKLELVGCLDFTGAESSCSSTASEFNIDSLKNFEFTGQNIFTLNRVDFFREGESTAEYTFNLPLFGKSLAGTGVITHTSRAVALDMPDVLRYIGFYDIELTNAVSTVRFRKKLHSVELFEALINSLSPNQVVNNVNSNVLVSGDHLRGVTYAALWDSTLSTEVANFEFVSNQLDPKHFLTLKITDNIPPGSYQIKINNTKGFVENPGTNDFTIIEPAPTVEMITKSFVTNSETQVVEIYGDGFLGLSDVVLKPSTTGQAGTSNSNMSIVHSQIPVQYSVTSRSLMSVIIPPFQLPGFYELSLQNTNPVSYLHDQVLEIRENPPTINTFSPNNAFYAESTELTVNGSNLLGVRGTTSSETYARLIHIDTDTSRDLDLVSEPSFNVLTLVVPENLLIGLYKLEIKNTQGVIDSLTTTEFEIQEGLVQLSSVTTQVLQYNADFSSNSNKISIYGKHLQGVKNIELVTTTLGNEYRYTIDHLLGTPTPYVSIENMPINTDLVYPGKYLLEITNEAGLTQPLTPVIDIQIPGSSITNFSPKTGPYNAPTEIEITGTNLRRFENLILERNVPSGSSPDDSINLLEISTNGDPDIFSEISNTKAHIRLISQETDNIFDDSLNRFYKIKWKTYGDEQINTVDLGGVPADSRFELTGYVPQINSFEDEFGAPLSETSDYVDDNSIGQVASLNVFSDLPSNLSVLGEHFGDIRAIKLVNYEDNSIEWTIACTTGTGASALNSGSISQLSVNIPREIFQFPASGVANNCNNDTGLLPLKPDLYVMVLEDGQKISSKVNRRAIIYFSEGPPDSLIVVDGIPTPPRFNNANDQIEITGNNLSGTSSISLFLNGAIQTSYSADNIQILSDNRVQFSIEAGTLRGIKDPIQSKYSLELTNSRSKVRFGTDDFIILEDEPIVTSIAPESGKNNTSHPIIISGSNLLGVGQTRGSTINKFRLIHEQSHYDSNITTISYDLTNSVTVQSLTSFVAVVPPRILPGNYFLSVENDHRETSDNPKLITDKLFESLDSVPVVTFVTPLLSDFDLLPTTMVVRGAGLIGVRTATLTLLSTVTSNVLTLSVMGSPELTEIRDDSVHFILPQSPDFLIPGTYNINLSNSVGEFNLPNFELLVREKSPQIVSIDPVSKSDFDNSTITTFTISGNNLFGMPNVSVHYQSTTVSVDITGVTQSRNLLSGLTLPASLFPDTWTLSLSNSVGSTFQTFIVTEPVPEVNAFDPTQVPFNDRTRITITGDHFLGVLTSTNSIVLTDELRTPLEDIELIDRYNISAWIPEGVNIGKYQVLVTNKRGKNTTSSILTVLGSGLSLDSITPNTGLVTGGEFVVLKGSGFVEGTRVAINNIMAQDVKVTPNQIEAFIPSFGATLSPTAVSTSVDVQVFNPDGESLVKLDFYTYFRDTETDPKILDVFPGVISGMLPNNIPVDTKIAVIFDQAVDPQTVLTEIPNTSDFNGLEVLSDSNLIGGTVTWSPDKTSFVYSSLNIPFLSDKLVEVGFANLITGENGRGLVTTDVVQTNSSFFGIGADKYIEDWSFTAGDSSDTGNLSITAPTGTGTMAPSTWTTTVIFNKPINPLTLLAEDFILTDVSKNQRIPVEVILLPGGMQVNINPTELLRANQNYKLTVKNTNLMSLTDLGMSSDYVYNLNSDPTGPNLVSLNPQSGRTGVARNAVIIAEFDQAILVESVNTSNLYVESTSGVRLDGTFSNTDDNLFFTFDFFDLLNAGETYNITVSNRIKSLTGVPITSGATSSFEVSTDNQIDLAGPVVLDIFPANLQSGVSTAAMIFVTFSESINLADVTPQNFSLRQIISESMSLEVSYRVDSNTDQDTVYLEPIMPLIHSADYEIVVTSGVRDLSNNKSINSVSVTFKVTPQSDLIGPGIDNVSPNNEATDVQINTQITILFNEPINAIDATDSSKIHVKKISGEEVIASYNQEEGGKLIRIIPQESLSRLTQYVVTIGQDVRDLFGNPRTQTTTFSFTTEDFVDSIPPEITLLTINGIPSGLNGNGGPLLNNLGNNVTPDIHVPTSGFTIDIYYYDPGSGGESSGVDQNTISIVDEKVVFDSNQNQPITNLNLLQQGVTPIHNNGHTRLIVPSNWSFAEGIHTLKAQVKDRSTAGNLSSEVSYSFQVTPISSEPLNYPFENGDAIFSLDYESDHFLYDTSVQLGSLRLRTLFESDGSIDFNQELTLLGLVSDDSLYEVGNPRLNPGNEPFPSTIAGNVVSLLRTMILQEVRKLFDLNELSGEPNDPSLGVKVRFENQISASNQSVSRIAIGGDNGAEVNGGLGVIKSMERSIYNTANRDPYLSLVNRSASVDEGYGVFSAQIIRNYANDPNGFNEWNARFGAVSYFAYTNTAGQSGQAIGFYPEDANVYNVDPSQVDSISNEFHRFRYSQMRLALESYAKIIAVSVARVAAKAVGLMPQGFPPSGLYGGSQNLPEYFNPSGSTGNFLDLVNENNLLRQEIDLNSIFQDNPGPLSLSNFAKIYLRNSIRVTQ